MSEVNKCIYAENCGGCSLWHESYDQQLHNKKDYLDHLASGLGSPIDTEIKHLKPSHLRDRADFQIGKQGEIGFYKKQDRTLLDIETCLAMSTPLQSAYKILRQYKFPISRGSLRLRHSPFIDKPGLWLDFSNEDVKYLFSEPTFLLSLLSSFHIEVGQRRKKLIWSEDEKRLRLMDPTPDLWFSTLINGEISPIYSLIGSFTQVGHKINKVLVENVLALAKPYHKILELGCGIGNFSLALASKESQVTAIDNDSSALLTLSKSVNHYKLNSIDVLKLDFYRKQDNEGPLTDLLKTHDLLLVDPPRSGLGSLLEPLKTNKTFLGPSTILYVSCHPESWRLDAELLHRAGYKLQTLIGVDQFPQTQHLELVSLFSLDPL